MVFPYHIQNHFGQMIFQPHFHAIFRVLGDDFRTGFRRKVIMHVMLADTVEAAVRSVLGKGQTLEEAEALVKTLMKDKLDDDQLDNSGLGIHELEIIRKAFIKVFHGMYHERVAYPKQEEIKAAEKKELSPAEHREEEKSESTD